MRVNAVEDMREEETRETAHEESEQIEYEQVSIRVPRSIMKLLRDSEKALEMSPQEYIECSVVRIVRADLDVGDIFIARGKQILKEYRLNGVFKALIDDPVTC
jgi:hypothetical protein